MRFAVALPWWGYALAFGLAGLLARGPADGTQDVNVVNRSSDPVPVEPT